VERAVADLLRFREVDAALHARALIEIVDGSKQSHWMWFVFPQLRALGRSPTAIHFGLDPEDAASFLADPMMGPRLVQITSALMAHAGLCSAEAIFGPVDALKLRSSMTLFDAQLGAHPIFAEVLAAFFSEPCLRTLDLLKAAGVARAG
jgi:uncharacterized protein (DUF1810 family)